MKPNGLWSGELELIARLSRFRPTDADDARASALAALPLDWARVIRLTHHHRVAPLVHENLERLDLPEVPRHVTDRLRQLRQSVARSNLFKCAAWLRVCQKLDERGVAGVTLKGFHLAMSVYRDVALRPVGDVDILVRDEDVPAALCALEDMGYRLPEGWAMALRHVGLAHVLRSTSEVPLVSGEGVVVDLHWRLRWNGVELRSDASPPKTVMRVGGQDVLVLPNAMSLPVLLLHGHGSAWGRLRWLVDVLEVLEGFSALEKQTTAHRLANLGADPLLTVVYWLADGLWGNAAPRTERSAFGRRAPSRGLKACLKMSLESDHDWWRVGAPGRNAALLRCRLSGGAGFARDLIPGFSPTYRDWAFVGLPCGLRAAYYVVRPGRILLKSVLSPGGRTPSTQA